ncbi:MAG TPA: hypothetical protein VGT02_18015 [Methylomirabilota bacterium]|nr:hypothetical protein [Methylomirabilota bacterium]
MSALVMPELCLLGAALLSSLAALAIGRGLRLPASGLRVALARTLECVGLAVVFLLLNLLLELALVLLARRAFGRFVSLYYAADATIVPISCLQALALCWWRHGTRALSR